MPFERDRISHGDQEEKTHGSSFSSSFAISVNMETSTTGIQIASFLRLARARVQERERERLPCPSFLFTDRLNAAGRSRPSSLIDTRSRSCAHHRESSHRQDDIESTFDHLTIVIEMDNRLIDPLNNKFRSSQRRAMRISCDLGSHLSLTNMCVWTF